MIFFASVRVGQGADYWPYLNLYLSSNKYASWTNIFGNEIGIEPGYVILSKILGIIKLPFNFLLLTIASISIYLKGKTILKYSPIIFVSLLYVYMPGIFVAEMGHMRQGISSAFCIFSIIYIFDKKLYKFLFIMYIAFLFHKTSIVFVPAYWLANANISTLKAFLIILLGFILWPLKPYLIIGDWLNSMTEDNIVKDSFNSYSGINESAITLTEAVKAIFIIIIFINDKYILKSNVDKNYMKVRNLILFFFFLYYSLHGNAIFSIRLAAVYQLSEMIIMPMLIRYSAPNIGKLVYIYYVIYVYLISFVFWSNARAVNFNHFSTFWNSPYFNLDYFTPK